MALLGAATSTKVNEQRDTLCYTLKIKKLGENYNGVTLRKSLVLRLQKRKPTKLSRLQSITSRHSLVLFEAMSSKKCSTVGPFTIMMQKV